MFLVLSFFILKTTGFDIFFSLFNNISSFKNFCSSGLTMTDLTNPNPIFFILNKESLLISSFLSIISKGVFNLLKSLILSFFNFAILALFSIKEFIKLLLNSPIPTFSGSFFNINSI